LLLLLGRDHGDGEAGGASVAYPDPVFLEAPRISKDTGDFAADIGDARIDDLTARFAALPLSEGRSALI
jgi:hypothetical protein